MNMHIEICSQVHAMDISKLTFRAWRATSYRARGMYVLDDEWFLTEGDYVFHGFIHYRLATV